MTMERMMTVLTISLGGMAVGFGDALPPHAPVLSSFSLSLFLPFFLAFPFVFCPEACGITRLSICDLKIAVPGS